MITTEQERDKYRRMWDCWQYRQNSPGERLVPVFLKEADWRLGDTLLDVGCGTGRAGKKLSESGLAVALFDIAANAPEIPALPFIEGCLWEMPQKLLRFTWFYCCDVMEHIPTEHVDDCLDNLEAIADKGFFQIALHYDGWGHLICDELHLTVKPDLWWLDKLTKRWMVTILPGRESDRLLCLVEGKRADRLRSIQ